MVDTRHDDDGDVGPRYIDGVAQRASVEKFVLLAGDDHAAKSSYSEELR